MLPNLKRKIIEFETRFQILMKVLNEFEIAIKYL